MKLVFNKNEEQEISVLFKSGENTTEFSYIHMIKKLIDVKRLEEPEFEGDFSDAEKDSVRSMIIHINREVTEFYSEDEE
ncbi:MAG: hypothetical protein COA48_08825 [Cycloclasticus sp.]|nr:MAG: hypothetical protein COA48_08825 [Cycloclasticus sp.]